MQMPNSPAVNRGNYLAWLEESSKSKLIKTVVGFRRSGKSYLLKMFVKQLTESGRAIRNNIFYLNFENDLLTDIKTVSDLRKVWELYLREIAVPRTSIYIIWDEIQLVKSWEKLVRALYETGEYNIFLTGSNSKLLSGELSGSLSGRTIELSIAPFDFKEYLEYLKLNQKDYYSNKHEIDKAFVRYLRRGGLAEQFDLNDDLAASYKDGLVQKIILDDIAKRYQIDKIKTLQNVFQFISGNITSTISLRKIAGRLKNQGVEVSLSTLDNYIYYWETSYAVSKLTKFDYKLSRVFDRTAKYYIVDNLFVAGREESDEKRLENLVYNELVRKHQKENIHFGSEENGHEVDFVVNKNGKFLLYQVCLNLNENNIKREMGSLNIAGRNLGGEREILVLERDIESTTNISITPIIGWLTSAG